MRPIAFSAGFASLPILRTTSLQTALILVTLLLYGCGAGSTTNVAKTAPVPEEITLSPASSSVSIGDTTMIMATEGSKQLSGGQWSVVGGAAQGLIDGTGLYTAPASIPAQNPVTIQYTQGGSSASLAVQILNPSPIVSSTSPASLSQVITTLTVIGNAFVPGSQVLVNAVPVPTSYVDSSHLSAVVTLAKPRSANFQITVANPTPGGATSAPVTVGANFPISLSPATATVRVGATDLISGLQGGLPVSGGQWVVTGGLGQGQIDVNGLYTAPSFLPASDPVAIQYVEQGETTATASVQVLGPVPVVASTNPSSISQNNTSITVIGSGFSTGSQVIVDQVAVPTIFLDQNHLTAIVTISDPTKTIVHLTVSNPDPGAAVSSVSALPVHLPLSLKAAISAIPVGSSTTIAASENGTAVTGGQWSVIGGSGQGSVDTTGTYTAPTSVPSVNPVTVQCVEGGTTATIQIQVTNPQPVITGTTPAVLSQINTGITVLGSGFLPGSQVLVNATPVSTAYVDSSHLHVTIALSKAENTTLQLVVSNTDPGAGTSLPLNVGTAFPTLSVAPATLSPGQITLVVSGSSFTQTSVVLVNGKAYSTTYNSSTSITATGYLPPWTSAPVDVSVSDSASGQTFAELNVPLAPVQVPYDTASRFATQAAFGPNPAVIAHIQQTGLQGYINEQFQTPALTYPLTGASPRSVYLQAAIQGISPLRLRAAWALCSYLDVPNSGFYPAVSEWEVKLEHAVTGNYRDLMTQLASDPMIGGTLNLTGNVAPSDPSLHPNQNFAREMMQLFTLGNVQLNDDGTEKLDTNGQPLPTYDQDTVINFSRVLTGWENRTPVNQQTTLWGVDYSQTLVPVESEHDTGAKVLFGSTLAAGNTTTQDRDQALDILFAHPNLPPYVSRILIQKLVKSSPSPEYVHRIVNVFKDDGTGTRGNLAAVISAILLDPEARAGDTAPSAADGFVQEPVLFEVFAMSALGNLGSDDQFSYWPGQLGENFWVPPSVFNFYSPSNLIPGTSINSPEFALTNNATIIHRSQLLWGIVTGRQPGLHGNANSWLYQNFPDVPSMVDALNHLLYHGQMPEAEKTMILNTCAQLDPSDVQTQLNTAVFLALNSDSYTVSH